MVALPDQLFYNTGISTYFWTSRTARRHAAHERILETLATPGMVESGNEMPVDSKAG